MRRALVLYTCDLRVHDHPALAAAVAEREQVVPAFVLDEQLMRGSCASPNRLTFLLESLRDLGASLRRRGAGLVLARGDAVEQAMRLARRCRADAIYMSEDTTPYACSRRRRLARACGEQRVELRTLDGSGLLAPGAVTPAGGCHYRVFTPYWRAWRQFPPAPVLPAPRRIPTVDGLPAMRLPALRSLTARSPSPDLAPGGESAARERLERFVSATLGGYEGGREDLAGDRTSKLSPYLHFGCISARAVLAATGEHPGAEPFERQLCWRDFHRQVLADRPDLPRADYRARGDRWRRDAASLEAWREGLTGYPIVDAGMRQLAREGFMHNRARLVAGSFLTKTLYLDWRAGAAHFAALLSDADIASNVGNWQWVAGTGNDTRPNRVLNPLRQARRFDPDGAYVRRYLPELEALSDGGVHEPWRASAAVRRGLRYPEPIVDLDRAAHELRERRGG